MGRACRGGNRSSIAFKHLLTVDAQEGYTALAFAHDSEVVYSDTLMHQASAQTVMDSLLANHHSYSGLHHCYEHMTVIMYVSPMNAQAPLACNPPGSACLPTRIQGAGSIRIHRVIYTTLCYTQACILIMYVSDHIELAGLACIRTIYHSLLCARSNKLRRCMRSFTKRYVSS